MGCGCVSRATGADAPLTSRDAALARQLQREEDARASKSGRDAVVPAPSRQPSWSTAGQGRALGAGAGAAADGAAGAAGLTPEERRQRALDAAERRQVEVPGLSKQKALELRERQQREAILGKLAEHYSKRKLDMPMGLNIASLEQLRQHLEHVQRGEAADTLVLQVQ
mmetsp:Transcript_90435/g.281249  ORF Transcript_90435/g.281249 Transcript_90435/m.281249 type:complete len:168 (-) Transcript_90435:83-586(-)